MEQNRDNFKPNTAMLADVRLEYRYRLSKSARLRPETFGGLAYTFRDQKLYFISPPLLPFLNATEGETVSLILERVQKEAGKRYSQKSIEAILTKLEELHSQEVLELLS